MKQLTNNVLGTTMKLSLGFMMGLWGASVGATPTHTSASSATAPHTQQRDPTLGYSVQYAVQKIQKKAHALDVNKNGVLDEPEKAAKRHKLGFLAGYAEDFLDADKNGVITVEEYIQVQSEMVQKTDTNNNGWIDEEEEKQQKREVLKRALSHLNM